MTEASAMLNSRGRRRPGLVALAAILDRWLIAVRPTHRVRWWRTLVFAYCGLATTIQLPRLLALRAKDPSDFRPIGILSLMSQPLPRWAWTAALAVSCGACGVAATTEWLRRSSRIATCVAAASFFVVATYRSSWGQLVWFDVLPTLHVCLVALTSDGENKRTRSEQPDVNHVRVSSIVLCATTTYLTYFVAGIAKVRIGGFAWLGREILADHVAYSAARLEVLGAASSPLAPTVLRNRWMLTAGAPIVVILELMAPLMVLSQRMCRGWSVAMLAFHAAIAATMYVIFPYHVFGLALLPALWAGSFREATARHDPDHPDATEHEGSQRTRISNRDPLRDP